MHNDRESQRRTALFRELEATRVAYERGRRVEAIGHLRLAEALCVHDELVEPPPPPTGVLLDIDAVSQKTGYSKSRLRHMGKTLAGYWKSPTGKVGWWSGPLEASLALNGTDG
jgi:hypothetical protein